MLHISIAYCTSKTIISHPYHIFRSISHKTIGIIWYHYIKSKHGPCFLFGPTGHVFHGGSRENSQPKWVPWSTAGWGHPKLVVLEKVTSPFLTHWQFLVIYVRFLGCVVFMFFFSFFRNHVRLGLRSDDGLDIKLCENHHQSLDGWGGCYPLEPPWCGASTAIWPRQMEIQCLTFDGRLFWNDQCRYPLKAAGIQGPSFMRALFFSRFLSRLFLVKLWELTPITVPKAKDGTPKWGIWRRIFLFKGVIFRFHVSFLGCK